MAIRKPTPKRTAPKKPSNWLSGGLFPGQSYTAWDTYGQGTPDFGKGAGPGTPYHKVVGNISAASYNPSKIQLPKSPKGPNPVYRAPKYQEQNIDPRTAIIRRRLGWT